MAWREVIQTGNVTREPGKKGTVRLFQFDGTQEQALIQPECPQLGDKLPSDAEQEVVSIVASYVDGSCRMAQIAVGYNSDGGATWGGNNPADPAFMSWSMSYWRVPQVIVGAIKDPRTHTYVENGTTKFIISYPERTRTYPEARKKYVRRLRIRSYSASVMDRIISKQQNKLHKIYGLWYLFQCGDIQEVARNTWDVAYSWEYDPGTPRLLTDTPKIRWASFLAPAWIGSDPIFYPYAQWHRPPYHQVGTIPVPLPNGDPDWPEFITDCLYDHSDPSGYTTLPGFSL